MNRQEVSGAEFDQLPSTTQRGNWRFWLDGGVTTPPKSIQTQTEAAGPAVRSFPNVSADLDAKTLTSLATVWAAANIPEGQIGSVMELATHIFEDAQFAEEWLNRPNPATDYKPPISLLGTENGLKRVKNLIHRLAYGIVA